MVRSSARSVCEKSCAYTCKGVQNNLEVLFYCKLKSTYLVVGCLSYCLIQTCVLLRRKKELAGVNCGFYLRRSLSSTVVSECLSGFELVLLHGFPQKDVWKQCVFNDGRLELAG